MEKLTIEQFIKKTNFNDLKKQKQALIQAITDADEKLSPDMSDKLNGLLSFIDSFQDMAVDTYGVKAEDVFNLSKG